MKTNVGYLLRSAIHQTTDLSRTMGFLCEAGRGGEEGAGAGEREEAEWSHTLPPHSGCVPLQEPFAWQVRSDDPRSTWPASQLKRIRLPGTKLSPRRIPWAGIPGSPHTLELVPVEQNQTSPAVFANKEWSR